MHIKFAIYTKFEAPEYVFIYINMYVYMCMYNEITIETRCELQSGSWKSKTVFDLI